MNLLDFVTYITLFDLVTYLAWCHGEKNGDSNVFRTNKGVCITVLVTCVKLLYMYLIIISCLYNSVVYVTSRDVRYSSGGGFCVWCERCACIVWCKNGCVYYIFPF